MTIPQMRGMYNGDRQRKQVLVDYGFRLPSALDNRPLNFEEFEATLNQVIYATATPGPYELKHSAQVVEQIIRPTGLVDPQVEIRPTKGQVDDLVGEIRKRVGRGRARARHHADQAHGRGPGRLPAGDRASRCTTCTPRSRRWSASRSCATCGWASTTWSSASTCCARASTCRRCAWWRSWTRTRRASCAPSRR